jgi:hypothetical protein
VTCPAEQLPATQVKSRYKGYLTNSAYQSARAQQLRMWIFDILGRKCAECGDEHGPFEVNHLYKREWSCARLSVYKRTLRYWRDVQRGLCNCLCASCNSNWRGYRPMSEAPPPEYVDPLFTAWMERNPPARKQTPPAIAEPF